jgi:RHS repeat-associated protein
MARAYLHDGDQVVVEYGKGVGSSSWRVQRRHLWGRWIDELAVEQVDMDGDGSLETSLWPVSDLLGSIELVTDGSGSIVERITYDPEGRPQVWGADTQRPRVTRVAWTGDGSDPRCPAGIPAVACPPGVFQLAFGEAVDGESAAGVTATLTPQGGQPVPLTVTLTPDTRAAYLTGATLQAGSSCTLHLEGLRDRAGNLLWQWGAHTGAPLLAFTLTDPTVFQVLEDTAPPRLLAALDAADGLYLALEEPVEVASGFNLDTSIAVLRQGQPVAGRVTRLSPQLFRWQPAEDSQWLVGGEYTLSAVHLQDLSGKAATAPSLSFTHMAASSQVAYLVYQAPGDSQPQARSAYGLTTLFQGRSWHEELGLYHYRARWYSPELGDFLQRDPLGYFDSPNLYQFVNRDPVNFLDPLGEWFIVAEAYDCGRGDKSDGRKSVPCATLSMYSNSGHELVPRIPALAQGLGGDRTEENGDTPFGVYITRDIKAVGEKGKEELSPVYDAVNIQEALKYKGAPDERARLTNLGTQLHRQSWSADRRKRPRSYGLGVINMRPIRREPGTENRTLIRIHGGGAGLGAHAFDLHHELLPTNGCIRVENYNALVLVHAIELASKIPDEKEDGIILVGDRAYLAELAQDQELASKWDSFQVVRTTGLPLETLRDFLRRIYGSR